MAFKTVPVPANIEAAFQTGIAKFFAANDERLNLLLHPRGPSFWLPIYTLGLNDIAHGAGLRAAQLDADSWRLLAGASNLSAATEVGRGPTGEWKVTSTSQGPRIDEALRAAQLAISDWQRRPELEQGNFQLRILSIPSLVTEAFWLKSEGGGSDFVIPYHTLIRGLEPGTTLSEKDFLSKTLGVARQRTAKRPPRH
jgi:hypothetical protein